MASEVATKKDLNVLEHRIDKKIDKAVDDLSGVISNFANQVDERFGQVDERFSQIGERFERLEAQIEKLEESHQQLINTIDHFLKRLDQFETENLVRDHQYARLERWVQKIAKQTGVKLDHD